MHQCSFVAITRLQRRDYGSALLGFNPDHGGAFPPLSSFRSSNWNALLCLIKPELTTPKKGSNGFFFSAFKPVYWAQKPDAGAVEKSRSTGGVLCPLLRRERGTKVINKCEKMHFIRGPVRAAAPEMMKHFLSS